MEGRHLAFIVSTACWCIGYFAIIYYVFCLFEHKCIKSEHLVNKSRNLKQSCILVLFTFAAPVLCGLMFRLGGAMEEGKNILWGCYISRFKLGVFLIWILSFISYTVILIFGLFKPTAFGFKKSRHIALSYIIILSYTLILLGLIAWGIDYFSGPLYGKYRSI